MMLRRRMRTIGIGVVALTFGLLAAWSMREHIQSREREFERQAKVETHMRLVAATDLSAGTRIQIDDLAVREIPSIWVPGGAFDPDALDQVLGGMLNGGLKQGDIVLRAHLAIEAEPTISELVSPGRRAVTLPANEINAVSGLLQVNDLIDLYVSFAHQGQHLTAPLLQSVRVLALDGRPGALTSITLDASEQDAAKLVAARHSGSLTAMLRHRGDVRISGSAVPGDLAALMGLAQSQAASRVDVPILYGDRVDAQSSPSQIFPALPDSDAGRIESPDPFSEQ